MRFLMKLVVILLCVQRGAARRLSPAPDQKPQTPLPNEDRGNGDAAAAPLPARRPRRSAPAAPCGLRSVLLQVRHLGLGYDSDESVLFKYCGGACPRVRSNHDLTLANLLLSGALPCCRPTHHEDAAFLDNAHRWHKVEKLSAAGCSCVG